MHANDVRLIAKKHLHDPRRRRYRRRSLPNEPPDDITAQLDVDDTGIGISDNTEPRMPTAVDQSVILLVKFHRPHDTARDATVAL